MTKDEGRQTTLADAQIYEKAVVKDLAAAGAIRRRLLELGVVRGTVITPLFKSPFGDPVAFLIRGTVIALRIADCKKILIYG